MAVWTYRTIDPSTGEAGPDLGTHDADAVDAALQAAHDAQRAWAARSFDERAAVLRRAAELLRARTDRYARRMAAEMGKPLAEGVSEANKCAWVCDHYAEHAEAFLFPEPHPSDGTASRVRYDPLGVILAIMPWNFPFWQVFRFAAPGLMAGNGFVLKHAPTVQGCADDILGVLREAGLPDGLAANLRLAEEQVASVIADPRIAGVTLTGSTGAGSAVGALAGEHLKKCVLELGGSDPFVVLSDADLDRAAEVGAQSRLLNSGQSCIAAKRFVVVREVADAFLERFEAQLRDQDVGPPLEEGTTIGPMAREDLRDALHDQVRRSVEGGATLRLGGEVPDGDGWFYPVTLLTDVGPGQPAWEEELFGPVAAVRVVDDAEAALQAANDTTFGLGASLWTSDHDTIERWAPRIRAGSLFVNGLVKSDPRLPFGGIRRSGIGRELGRHGIREFTNAKTVWIR